MTGTDAWIGETAPYFFFLLGGEGPSKLEFTVAEGPLSIARNFTKRNCHKSLLVNDF